jgi:dolichol kinase
MPDLPSHPDTGTGAPPGPDRISGSRRSRWKTIAGIAVALLVLVVFVVLHLTGVIGPGEH